MKRISEKLKSRRGASMVFALLVFLLCLLAGTAALTAASSNVGRYTHLEDEQRQYFSAASALKVLQGWMNSDKGKVTIEVTRKETVEWTVNAAGVTEFKDPKYEITLDPSTGITYFQNLMLQNCLPAGWRDNIDPTSFGVVPTDVDKHYTIDLDRSGLADAEWADSVYEVNVNMRNGTADGPFNLIAYLSTKDGSAYPLKVEWPGQVETKMEEPEVVTSGTAETGTRETTTTVTLTLAWSGADRQITFEKAPA